MRRWTQTTHIQLPFPIQREHVLHETREKDEIFCTFWKYLHIVLYCIVLYGEEDHVFGITVLRKKMWRIKKIVKNHNIVTCNRLVFKPFATLDSWKGIPATPSGWYTFINSLVGEIEFPLVSFYKTHCENISKARLFFFFLDRFLHDTTARKRYRLRDQLISWRGFEDSLAGERDFPLCPSTEHIAKHFTGGKPIELFFFK